MLSSLGISDAVTARNVYEYIAEEPANYMKYYIGYLEILRLQDTARELWQEEYSDLRFHKFFWKPVPPTLPPCGSCCFVDKPRISLYTLHGGESYGKSDFQSECNGTCFLMMVLGYVLRRLKVVDEPFVKP